MLALASPPRPQTLAASRPQFYSSFHQNSVNVAIHLACIWPLLATALVICDSSTPFAPTPPVLAPYLTLNASAIVAAIYALYYLALDCMGLYGLMSALGVVGCYSFAHSYSASAPQPVATALSIHVICWLAQFAGHALFEGRAPALFQNLAQALLMAPHFVLVECYFALGLRSNLAAKVEPLVKARLGAFKQAHSHDD